MANLVLEACDRFVVLYDLVALVNDDVPTESALASAVHLSPDVVNELLSFMLAQGYVKTARSDNEFKITALGSSFLQEFRGMRRFLS
jgi:predicted transcriptional regulator